MVQASTVQWFWRHEPRQRARQRTPTCHDARSAANSQPFAGNYPLLRYIQDEWKKKSIAARQAVGLIIAATLLFSVF